eukprot:COSAG01_NODE_8119_length_2867_cov_8.576199_5_plen_151_part_00
MRQAGMQQQAQAAAGSRADEKVCLMKRSCAAKRYDSSGFAEPCSAMPAGVREFVAVAVGQTPEKPRRPAARPPAQPRPGCFRGRMPTVKSLDDYSYRELQALCKANGLRAVGSSVVLRRQLEAQPPPPESEDDGWALLTRTWDGRHDRAW